ncbi:MAG: hypothetical protein AAF944_03585 [Bacteroidota bacterium]
MEEFYPLAISLFLLSQISERIANIIKLYLLDNELLVARNNPLLETKKEKKVIIHSVISGFLVAILFEGMLQDTEFSNGLGLQLFKNNEWWFVPIRVLFMTLLLGFGSKFWHDILDLLFYYKKVKKSLANGEIFHYDEVKLIEEHVELHGSQLVTQCMKQNKAWLDTLEGVNYGLGYEEIDGKITDTIVFYTDNPTSASKIPKELTYRSQGGVLYRVPTKVHCTGPAKTQEAHITKAGESISNKENPDNKGTFGCIMADHDCKPVLLTCYHVVKTKNQKWEKFEDANGKYSHIISSQSNKVIGQIREGFRNYRYDISLVDQIDLNAVINGESNGVAIPEAVRKLTDEDAKQRTKVYFSGMTKSYERSGHILNVDFARRIYYDGSNTTFTLFGLIVFSNQPQEPYKNPSNQGDSGAILYTYEHEAVGMIVAGDDFFGYAIPFYDIVSHFNLKPLSQCTA